MKTSQNIFAALIASSIACFVASPALAEGNARPDDAGVAPTASDVLPALHASRAPSFDAGIRTMILPSAGFDPFSRDDFLWAPGVGVGVPLFLRNGLSLGVHAEYDYGARGDTARGLATDLAVHRIAFGFEPRARVLPRLDVFTRLEGEAFHLRGSIEPGGQVSPLVLHTWTYGVEVAGGLAIEMTSPRSRVHLHFLTQLGYSFAKDADMFFAPDAGPDSERKSGSVQLPSFKPQGASTRMAFSLSL